MTVHVTRIVLVLAIATATACNTPRSGTDAPPAEEPGAAATTASAGETPRAPANQAPAATAAQAAKAAEAQRERVIAEQKALNEQQAETNARLQQEVERLKPREITIPAGTVIPVRTVSELSTSTLSDGATFDAVLDRDLSVGDVVVAKAGTRATGVVVTADKGGRVKGTASLAVGLRALMGTKSNVIAVKTDWYSTEADRSQEEGCRSDWRRDRRRCSHWRHRRRREWRGHWRRRRCGGGRRHERGDPRSGSGDPGRAADGVPPDRAGDNRDSALNNERASTWRASCANEHLDTESGPFNHRSQEVVHTLQVSIPLIYEPRGPSWRSRGAAAARGPPLETRRRGRRSIG